MKSKRNDIDKELGKHAPLLGRLRGDDPGFRIPEGYFDRLTDQVMEQIRYTPAPEVFGKTKAHWYSAVITALSDLRRPRYALPLATVAILLVAGLFWLRPKTADLTAAVAWSDLSVEEMAEYVENNIQEFELDLLVEMAPDLEDRSILSGVEIEGEALEDYLEEIIDDVEMEDLENLF